MCFQTGTIGTLYPLFEPIPPFLVQMTVVHEPCLKLSQFCPHLPALLCKTLGRCTLLLGVLAMGRTSCCKARQAILCLRSCGSATMQRTASVALVRRPLAGRALTGLGPAPLAGPIGAKAPRNALLKVVFCHAEISASYGVLLYPIIGGGARVGWLGGLCFLVAAKTNNAILYIRLQRPRILCVDCDQYIHSY